jgi:hypothetical protein
MGMQFKFYRVMNSFVDGDHQITDVATPEEALDACAKFVGSREYPIGFGFGSDDGDQCRYHEEVWELSVPLVVHIRSDKQSNSTTIDSDVIWLPAAAWDFVKTVRASGLYPEGFRVRFEQPAVTDRQRMEERLEAQKAEQDERNQRIDLTKLSPGSWSDGAITDYEELMYGADELDYITEELKAWINKYAPSIGGALAVPYSDRISYQDYCDTAYYFLIHYVVQELLNEQVDPGTPLTDEQKETIGHCTFLTLEILETLTSCSKMSRSGITWNLSQS